MRGSSLFTVYLLRGDNDARMRTAVDAHQEFAKRPAIFNALTACRLWRRLLVGLHAFANSNSESLSVAYFRDAFERARGFCLADDDGQRHRFRSEFDCAVESRQSHAYFRQFYAAAGYADARGSGIGGTCTDCGCKSGAGR